MRLERRQVDLDELVEDVVGRASNASASVRRCVDAPWRRRRRSPRVPSPSGTRRRGRRSRRSTWWRRSRRPCCRWWRWPVARDRLGAGTEVLDDRARAALHREDLGDLEDDVLGRRPAAERAGEVHADDLGPAHAERRADHHVDGVGAADTDRRSCRGRPRSACGCRCRSSSRPGTRTARARPDG